jgi:hypothetical protein
VTEAGLAVTLKSQKTIGDWKSKQVEQHDLEPLEIDEDLHDIAFADEVEVIPQKSEEVKEETQKEEEFVEKKEEFNDAESVAESVRIHEPVIKEDASEVASQ